MRSEPSPSGAQPDAFSGAPPRRVLRWLGECALLAAAYALTGHAGLELTHAHSSATLVWPPSGLAVGALLLAGPRLTCGVLVGALLVNVWNGTPLIPSFGIAIGNSAEALVAYLLLRRAGFDARLGRMRDLLALAGLGALAATTVAAVGGTISLALAGLLAGHSPAEVAVVWWLGDAAGVLVFAPVLLVAARGAPPWRALLRAELVLAAALIVLTSIAAFGAALPPWLALLAALAGSPLIVWVGLRGGPRGAVLASLLAALPAMLETTAGRGPLAGPDRLASVALLLAYCTSLSATALVLAAAIRERDAAESARARAQEENARLSRIVARTERLQSIGLLAGGVAHDFNNLLAVIQTNATVARAALPAASAGHEAITDVLDASARAADICAQLLEVGGRVTMTPITFDLRAAADETLALLRKTTGDSIVLRCEPGAPVPMAGDRGRIAQLVFNLVHNAVDAIGERAGTVVVRVAGDAPPPDAALAWSSDIDPGEPLVSLEVEDDGAGMDDETSQRLFEPFFTTKPGGRGLGTAGVLGAVRAHGGAIAVRSTPGKGTTFRVLLPRGDVDASAPRSAPPASEPAPSPRSGKLLLADDEHALRRTVGRALERAGWSVHQAADGAEALACFAEDPPSWTAVVLDVRMPVLSGPDALEKMRALRPDLPAVLVTGYATDAELRGGGTRVVQKPFQVAQLVGAIDAEIAARVTRA